MLYNLRHALAGNVSPVVSPGPVEVGDFLFRLAVFFGLVLSLNLQVKLNGIHRSQKIYSTEPQGARKSDFYSERKVFLSGVCVVYVL